MRPFTTAILCKLLKDGCHKEAIECISIEGLTDIGVAVAYVIAFSAALFNPILSILICMGMWIYSAAVMKLH